ncbi:uncharacterized protein FIBRA_08286 [Fibroporia radiculosa]|uniref:Vacuolar-sorting protein SNF7 n=1 Tax=Fibroporia radiculosa TaxID=599839 RepID=J4GWI4_9APHY|nr:uncharacterized protein FIBRA_08286 [Fibroporia radiculosa]CCM06040.1 predicted protein [Fibroporia radiculosa]
MAAFMSYFGGRRDPKESSRDAIVTLRQQLQMIDKKEEYLQKKIDDELKKAKANAVANKNGKQHPLRTGTGSFIPELCTFVTYGQCTVDVAATAALRRKKATEQELDRLQGTRFQLEMQVNTLESASFNAETMAAMKQANIALKHIHGATSIDTVDRTVNEIQEQTQLANEISEAISTSAYTGVEIDEDELKDELAELEQDELNERLMGADHVPAHQPPGTSRVADTAEDPVEEEIVEEGDELETENVDVLSVEEGSEVVAKLIDVLVNATAQKRLARPSAVDKLVGHPAAMQLVNFEAKIAELKMCEYAVPFAWHMDHPLKLGYEAVLVEEAFTLPLLPTPKVNVAVPETAAEELDEDEVTVFETATAERNTDKKESNSDAGRTTNIVVDDDKDKRKGSFGVAKATE